MSPTRPVLGVLVDRSGEPDFCLANSGCDEFALLNALLARPRACIEPLRDRRLERSSAPFGTSLSSDVIGVKPASPNALMKSCAAVATACKGKLNSN